MRDLPFIASNLIEVKRIVEAYGVGEIVKERTPQSLAKQIRNMSVVNSEKYQKAQEEALLGKGTKGVAKSY